jgi:hypothetical protein
MGVIDESAFIPSSSPYFDRPLPLHQEAGENLFNHTSQFYAWYLSWQRDPSEHKETFSLLSTIMQVAKISLQGGFYLNKEKEQEAVEKLEDLGDEMINGTFPPHDISAMIGSILNNLIDNNPKAKLIAKSILLEYKLLIHSSNQQSLQLTDDYHHVMDRLISKVTPLLKDFDAEKLSRELSKFIETPQDPEKTIDTLNTLLDTWP